MTFEEILVHRRSVRKYDPTKEIDSETVKRCILLSTLAPTSSNMQLWEAYHVTDPEILRQLSKACLGQLAASSAKQMVIFVTRQDLHRQRAHAVLTFERGNITHNSSPARQAKRIERRELYYTRIIPFLYARCFGLLGALRKTLTWCFGLFRPMVHQVSEGDMRVVVHKSCGLIAQTFMLAMSDAGYDTCPMEGFDSRMVKRMLKLPRGTEINMIISCGMRLPEGVWGERFRVPFDQVYRKI